MDFESIPWPGGDWQATARLFGALVGGYLLVLWFASILWVYRDIQARTRDPITQAIGVGIAIAFPLLGLPVYMVVRPQETLQEAYDRQLEQEAILSELHSITGCPNCRRPVNEDFMVCAYCGTALKAPCGSCSRLLQFSWRVCPTCATPKPRPQPDPAELARQREADAAARRPSMPAASTAPRTGQARPAEPRASAGQTRTAGTSAPRPARPARTNEGAPPARRPTGTDD
ncbi:MAG: zinc ribbon domain-containing protein [Dehalococcoidia bacterium]